jgi:hypothetical protein
MNMSEKTDALFAALAKAQAEMGRASKDGKNPHYKSKYATLTAVLETILPPLNANGLTLSQHPGLDGEVVTLTTIIGHTSGQWMSSQSAVPLGKKRDAHAYGSAVSYLRRYSSAAVMGCIQDDDDGNAASRIQSRNNVSLPTASPMTAPELDKACDDAGFSLDEMRAWCKAHNRPDPLGMRLDQQRQMLRWIHGDGSGAVRTWLIEQAGGEG